MNGARKKTLRPQHAQMESKEKQETTIKAKTIYKPQLYKVNYEHSKEKIRLTFLTHKGTVSGYHHFLIA